MLMCCHYFADSHPRRVQGFMVDFTLAAADATWKMPKAYTVTVTVTWFRICLNTP
jgi:hypothetical protein